MKRGKKQNTRFIIGSCVIILLVALIVFASNFFYASDVASDLEISSNVVSRVIDGDTFELANGEIVRLLCIDAPEKGEEGYSESKAFLTALIEGKTVRLEKDTSDRDAYDRLLRYVYVHVIDHDFMEHEVFVNEIVYTGDYAEGMLIAPDVHKCSWAL